MTIKKLFKMFFACALVIVLAASAFVDTVHAATFTSVQTSTISGGTTSTITNTITATTQGNLVVLTLNDLTASENLTSVTDNVGNVYTVAKESGNTVFNTWEAYGVQVTGGATVITATFSAAVGLKNIGAQEFSAGTPWANNADAVYAISTTGSSTVTTSSAVPSFSTGSGNLVVASLGMSVAQAVTPGSGYTKSFSSASVINSEYTLSSSGTETAPMTFASSRYGEVAIAFKAPGSSLPTPLLVQQQFGIASFGAPIVTSMPAAITAGDMLIVDSTDIGTGAITGITGGGVTTWTKVILTTDSAGNADEIWYGRSTGGSSSITLTSSSESTGWKVNISEWFGLSSSDPATDASHGQTTSSASTITTGAITPTAGVARVIIAGAESSQTTLATAMPAGFSALVGNTTPGNPAFVYEIATSTSGSYTATWTIAAFNRAAAAGASFIVSSGPSNTTAVGDGSNPSSVTIAPGASATMADAFTLQTSSSTDSVTAATIALGSGAHTGIGLVEITDNAGSTVYGSTSNPSSDTDVVTLTTPISVTTSSTQYKIRITPLSHAAMPAPPGSSYTVTPTIAAFASTNTATGTDATSATITIDNTSPAAVTSATVTAGSGQNALAWTNPTDADYAQTLVLQATSTISGFTPVEGTSYSTSTVVSGTSLSGYSFNRSITIDHTKVGSTDSSNFPVLVSGTYSYLEATSSGGKVQNTSGFDVNFTSDAACATKLNWETEKYVSTTGEVDYWVNIPTVSHTTNTVFYMCYGNSSITTDQSHKTSTWDTNFKAVYHLPNASTLSMNDSTSNANNGTGVVSPSAVAGQIDGGASFNGTSQGINMGTGSSLAIGAGQAFTVSAWYKTTAVSGTIFSMRDSATGDTVLDITIGFDGATTANGQLEALARKDGGSSIFEIVSPTTSNDGAWHQVTLTRNTSDVMTLYQDGVSKGTIATDNGAMTGNLNTIGQELYWINNSSNTTAQRYFNGSLDEVEFSVGSARSADWVTANFNEGNSPSTFYTVGSENSGATYVTVVCVTSATSCTDTSLTAGTPYYYEIFTVDSHGNYSATGVVPTGSPATPTLVGISSVTVNHYRWRFDNGSESSATYSAAEDTSTTAAIGDRERLRFQVSNTSTTTSAANYNYLLEVSSTSTNSWIPVSNASSPGSNPWAMDVTSNYTDGSLTTDSAGVDDPPSAATTTPVLVQQQVGTFGKTNFTAGTTFTGTSGNLVILTVGIAGHAPFDVVSVTGGGATGWHLIKAQDDGVDWDAEIWAGVADGSTSGVSITTAGGIDPGCVYTLSEWSGLVTSGTLTDSTGSNSGEGATLSTGTLSPTSGNPDVQIAVGSSQVGMIGTDPAGYTAFSGVGAASGTHFPAGYQIVSSASGTYAPAWSTGNAFELFAGVSASFKVAAGAPSSYSYNRSITIDHTKVPNTDQTNFPILVSGTYSYLATAANGGNVQNSSGYDVIFTSDSGCTTKLNWETEKYVASTGEVDYWIKIPTLSHTVDTVIYMCYGNGSISSDQSSATSVWDSNYKAVYHLPNGSSLSTNDSTSNAFNGTNHSATAATGQIDGAVGLSGTGQYIALPTGVDSSVSGGTQVTVSGWFKGSAMQSMIRMQPSSPDYIALGWSTPPLAIISTDGGTATGVPIGGNVQDGSWHYVVMTWQKNTVNGFKVYVDGAITNQRTSANANLPTISGASNIGTYDGATEFTTGTVDEARISTIARSADWITAEYNNQNSPSTFYTVGSALQSGASFTPGYAMSANDQTPNETIPVGQFTELEYSIRSTSNVTPGTVYSFRLSNAGATSTFTYAVTPQISVTNTINAKNGGGGGGGFIESVGSGPVESGGNNSGGGGGTGEGTGGGTGQGGGGSGGGGGISFNFGNFQTLFMASPDFILKVFAMK